MMVDVSTPKILKSERSLFFKYPLLTSQYKWRTNACSLSYKRLFIFVRAVGIDRKLASCMTYERPVGWRLGWSRLVIGSLGRGQAAVFVV